MSPPRSSRRTIVVPSTFSVSRQMDDTLAVFRFMVKHAANRHDIAVDMSSVKSIDADAIICLLLYLHNIQVRYRHCRVEGNEPQDAECRRLFRASGFYQAIRQSRSTQFEENDVFSVKSGRHSEPKVAKAIVDFARARLQINKGPQTKSTYATILECMANTANHAYSERGETSRWWLLAAHSPDSDEIKFAFVDSGLGIPSTMKRKLTERLSIASDAVLITEALRGNNRTRTGHANRGKGLPKICSDAQSGHLSNLTIFSNGGRVTVGPGSTNETYIRSSFQGTLITWSMVRR
ncbi:MAG: hypothetical protein K1X75_17955 [Leptospirales bacterium]|nr:hypothetical protein [Leptospirales bacterium]